MAGPRCEAYLVSPGERDWLGPRPCLSRTVSTLARLTSLISIQPTPKSPFIICVCSKSDKAFSP